MKAKFIIVLLLCLSFITIPVYADNKVYTTITGDENVVKGSSVTYTVIIDTKLTEYEAEIKYDREALNLVSIDEVKVDTETKAFTAEKEDPIKIIVTSEEPTIIAYTIKFDVKESTKLNKTTLEVIPSVTNTLENRKEVKLSSDDYSYELSIDEKEETDISDIPDNPTEIKKTVSKIRKFFNDYRDIIMYSSLGLNLILLISLIASIRRKKVDYDF